MSNMTIKTIKKYAVRLALPIMAMCMMGCPIGPAALPQPTKRKVADKDVIGTWVFEDSGWKVTIGIKPDGTFTQTAENTSKGTKKVLDGGKWTRKGATVEVDGYMPVIYSNETKETMGWYMVDDGPGLALFGGDHPDPDSWREMKRIK